MWNTIKSWWHYSRTIFVNVFSALVLSSTEIVAYLSGAQWASIVQNPKTLFWIAVGLNLLNIYLRTITTTPPGGKPES